MPSAPAESTMQSIVAVESLCPKNEDENTGQMVLASVVSLAATGYDGSSSDQCAVSRPAVPNIIPEGAARVSALPRVVLPGSSVTITLVGNQKNTRVTPLAEVSSTSSDSSLVTCLPTTRLPTKAGSVQTSLGEKQDLRAENCANDVIEIPDSDDDDVCITRIEAPRLHGHRSRLAPPALVMNVDPSSTSPSSAWSLHNTCPATTAATTLRNSQNTKGLSPLGTPNASSSMLQQTPVVSSSCGVIGSDCQGPSTAFIYATRSASVLNPSHPSGCLGDGQQHALGKQSVSLRNHDLNGSQISGVLPQQYGVPTLGCPKTYTRRGNNGSQLIQKPLQASMSSHSAPGAVSCSNAQMPLLDGLAEFSAASSSGDQQVSISASILPQHLRSNAASMCLLTPSSTVSTVSSTGYAQRHRLPLRGRPPQACHGELHASTDTVSTRPQTSPLFDVLPKVETLTYDSEGSLSTPNCAINGSLKRESCSVIKGPLINSKSNEYIGFALRGAVGGGSLPSAYTRTQAPFPSVTGLRNCNQVQISGPSFLTPPPNAVVNNELPDFTMPNAQSANQISRATFCNKRGGQLEKATNYLASTLAVNHQKDLLACKYNYKSNENSCSPKNLSRFKEQSGSSSLLRHRRSRPAGKLRRDISSDEDTPAPARVKRRRLESEQLIFNGGNDTSADHLSSELEAGATGTPALISSCLSLAQRQHKELTSSPAFTPQAEFLYNIGLCPTVDAERVRAIKPLKKDVVAALKDRRTIKRYIFHPLVPTTKADCIYKYVITKNYMKEEAFKILRSTTNVKGTAASKLKRRKPRSLLITKPKKKKIVLQPSSTEKIEQNTISSVDETLSTTERAGDTLKLTDCKSSSNSDTEIDESGAFGKLHAASSTVSAEPSSSRPSHDNPERYTPISWNMDSKLLHQILGEFEEKGVWTSFSSLSRQAALPCPMIVLSRLAVWADNEQREGTCSTAYNTRVEFVEQLKYAALESVGLHNETSIAQGARPFELRCKRCTFSCLNIFSLRRHYEEYHTIHHCN